MRRTTRTRLAAVAGLALAVLAAACGGGAERGRPSTLPTLPPSFASTTSTLPRVTAPDGSTVPSVATTTDHHPARGVAAHRPPRRRRAPRRAAGPRREDRQPPEGPPPGRAGPGRRRLRGDRRGHHPVLRRVPLHGRRPRRSGPVGPDHRHRPAAPAAAPAVRLVGRQQRHDQGPPGGRRRHRRGLRLPLQGGRLLPRRGAPLAPQPLLHHDRAVGAQPAGRRAASSDVHVPGRGRAGPGRARGGRQADDVRDEGAVAVGPGRRRVAPHAGRPTPRGRQRHPRSRRPTSWSCSWSTAAARPTPSRPRPSRSARATPSCSPAATSSPVAGSGPTRPSPRRWSTRPGRRSSSRPAAPGWSSRAPTAPTWCRQATDPATVPYPSGK